MAKRTGNNQGWSGLIEVQQSQLAELSAIRNVIENTSGGANAKENQMESSRKQDRMLSLLESIARNTTSDGSGEKSSGGGVGMLGTVLAASLGALVGYIQGYVKILGKLSQAILPEKWIAAIKNSFNTVVGFFKNIGNVVAKGFKSVSDLLKIDGDSNIGKTLKSFKEGLTKFFAPIEEGLKFIKEGSASVQRGIGWVGKFMTRIKSFLGGISEMGGYLSKIFKGAMGIFSKLALPLTVIMTLWDTVKETIEGFEKEGIIGGIKGAVTGFFNSLIFGPLDMIKSAISWVLGVFGFENAEKVLDEFSFQETFKDIVAALFRPVEWIKEKAVAILDWLKEKTKGVLNFFGIGTDDSTPKEVKPLPQSNYESAPSEFSGMEDYIEPSSGAVKKAVIVPSAASAGAAKRVGFVSGGKSGSPTVIVPASSSVASSVSTQNVTTGANILNTSSQNSMSQILGGNNSSGGTTIVNAPTMNSMTKNTAVVRNQIRNTDASLSRYLNTRHTY